MPAVYLGRDLGTGPLVMGSSVCQADDSARRPASMSWYRHHWWWVGVVVAAGVVVYLAVAWGDLDIEQRVMLGSFLVLLLHEAEEWAWPGGEPAVLNKVITRSPMGKVIGAGASEENADRYPSNANSAMVVNVFAAYPVYILAVIFSDQIWLGLFAAFFFWLGQLVFHGVLTNLVAQVGIQPGTPHDRGWGCAWHLLRLPRRIQQPGKRMGLDWRAPASPGVRRSRDAEADVHLAGRQGLALPVHRRRDAEVERRRTTRKTPLARLQSRRRSC